MTIACYEGALDTPSTARFYEICCAAYPLVLVGVAVGSRLRWPATAVAGMHTVTGTPRAAPTWARAAAWLPGSVAPQQSDSSKHSRPRSLASRIRGGGDTGPRAAGLVGCCVRNHRAEHQYALVAEVDAAGFLG